MPLKLRALSFSLFTRMALILLAGLSVAQLASIWLQRSERDTVVMQAHGQNFVDRIAETIRVLEANESSRRNAALSALQSNNLRVAMIAEDQVSPNTPRGQIRAMIGLRIGDEREIRSDFGGGMQGGGYGGMQQRAFPIRTLDVRLRDGQWVRISAVHESAAPALSNELIVNLLVTTITVITVVMIAVRQATIPLRHLADAADKFGHNLDSPPLAEEGPTETRRAAQAFNRMQARIKRLVDERARALAAVSHDLRTPLTRLRLRTELVGDEKLREQMASDLESMAAMIDVTLDYLRGFQDSEAPRPIDMNALLHSLEEDAAVLGKSISVEGVSLAPYTGRLLALRRALQNLIDNAIKYGHVARVRIEDDDATLRLVIEDDGPGIPPAEIPLVREPYCRLDVSRRRETGGVGLGLSIVNDIALMHGGELVLSNRVQGGFSATLVLPRGKYPPAEPGGLPC